MCRPLTHRVAGRPRIRETYWLHMANLELAPALAVWGELPLPILPRLCRTRRLARSLELGRVERDDAQLAADGAAPEGVLPLARVEAQRRLPDPRVGMEVDESEDGIVNVVVILPSGRAVLTFPRDRARPSACLSAFVSTFCVYSTLLARARGTTRARWPARAPDRGRRRGARPDFFTAATGSAQWNAPAGVNRRYCAAAPLRNRVNLR